MIRLATYMHLGQPAPVPVSSHCGIVGAASGHQANRRVNAIVCWYSWLSMAKVLRLTGSFAQLESFALESPAGDIFYRCQEGCVGFACSSRVWRRFAAGLAPNCWGWKVDSRGSGFGKRRLPISKAKCQLPPGRFLPQSTHTHTQEAAFSPSRRSITATMGKRGLPRASCEECRRKKARCDLPDRTALGGTSCTWCSAKRLPCRLEQGARGRRHESVQSIPSKASSPSTAPSSTSDASATPALPDELYLPGSRHLSRSASAVGSANSQTTTTNTNSAVSAHIGSPASATGAIPAAGLLDVPGLSYPLLQETIDAYFATAGHLNPSLEQHDFRRRCRAYFAPLFSCAPDHVAEEISPLIILAVAAVGIAHTTRPARFDLQRRIVLRAEQIAKLGMLPHGLDGITAVLILEGIAYTAEGAPIFWPKNPDPLHLHPFSHEAPVRLTRHLNLHRHTSNTRETLLFWHIYAFNCWRPDTFEYLHPREVDLERPPRGTLLGDWHDSLLTLGEIHQEIHDLCWTGPHRKQGIAPAQIISLLKRLHEYERAHIGSLASQTIAQHSEADLGKSAQQGLVRILYYNTIMSLEAYARVAGLEAGSADVAEARTMLRTNTTRAFSQIVHIAAEAAQRGYFGFHVRAFRSLTVGCVMWCIERIRRAHEHARVDAGLWLTSCGERMIDAIDSTTTCCVDTPPLVLELRAQLLQAQLMQESAVQLPPPAISPFDGSDASELWSWLLDPAFYDAIQPSV